MAQSFYGALRSQLATLAFGDSMQKHVLKSTTRIACVKWGSRKQIEFHGVHCPTSLA